MAPNLPTAWCFFKKPWSERNNNPLYDVANCSVDGKTKPCITHYQGYNYIEDDRRGRGIHSITKWRRKHISITSNFQLAERGEEGWGRLQHGKQQLWGSPFPLSAGRLTWRRSGTTGYYTVRSVCCWDRREAAVGLPGYWSSLPPLQTEEVWCGAETQQKVLSFPLFWRANELWCSLLLAEPIREEKVRQGGKTTGLAGKAEDSHHVWHEQEGTAEISKAPWGRGSWEDGAAVEKGDRKAGQGG